MKILFVFAIITTLNSGSCNYFFATHKNYTMSTLNVPVLSSKNIIGDLTTVTQQCRRYCVLNPLCQAFHLGQLLSTSGLAKYNCSIFASNSCNWPDTKRQPGTAGRVRKLWDKLDATNFKAKPCEEHCRVKFRGDCMACRGYEGFQGIDCEIPPRICSDYATNLTDVRRPVWPWGFEGPTYSVQCYGVWTELFYTTTNNGDKWLSILGWPAKNMTKDVTTYFSFFNLIDWELISRMQRLSKEKKMRIQMNSHVHTFTGLDITPYGNLSLHSSIENSSFPGIPLPLVNVPFLVGPNVNCGPFWQFSKNVALCNQGTNLLNFDNLKWNYTLLDISYRASIQFL